MSAHKTFTIMAIIFLANRKIHSGLLLHNVVKKPRYQQFLSFFAVIQENA